MNTTRGGRRAFAISSIVVVVIVIFVLFEFGVRKHTTPQNPAQFLQSAASSYDANDFTTALSQTDAILAASPENVEALVAKASILAQEGSLQFKENEFGTQAIAVAQQAIAIDPNSSDAWRVIGYANEIMHRYPQAHVAYARSLATDPNNALTLSQEAHAYDLQGDLAKAEAGYRAALR